MHTESGSWLGMRNGEHRASRPPLTPKTGPQVCPASPIGFLREARLLTPRMGYPICLGRLPSGHCCFKHKGRPDRVSSSQQGPGWPHRELPRPNSVITSLWPWHQRGRTGKKRAGALKEEKAYNLLSSRSCPTISTTKPPKT